jgi:DNA mismatch repair protein MutL
MTDRTTLSGKISVLPGTLVNRIAAGEVVERPASVVKELIENSIDAGSSQIQIEVKAGGRLLIRLQDNGQGMSSEDAPLAFERHATSKIRSDQDLLCVQTLGFRGEALPSIAAVSKTRMLTAPQDCAAGTEITIDGGQLQKIQEAGASPGTLIEVKELFYNTPARLKFLKSIQTEMGHISHLVQQQALAHSHISFRLSHNGKCILDLPAVAEKIYRIQQVYGKAFADHLIPIENEWAKVRVLGVISKPPYTKGTRSYQEIFVNRRAISSPFILHAVYEGYGVSIMKGQHPVAILFLEMDGRMLDVNVHPAKREVRFQDQKLVHDLVRESVKTTLQRVSRAEVYPVDIHLQPTRAEQVRESAQAYLKSQDFISGYDAKPRQGQDESSGNFELVESRPVGKKEELSFPGILERALPLGQVNDTYIIASIHGELWIIDQHAAHERVLFERMLKSIQSSSIPIQRLLIPETLELPTAQGVVLSEWVNQLQSMGIEMESFGPRTLAIRAVPTYLAQADLQGLMLDLIEDWTQFEKTPSAQDRQNPLVATMACHAAVKANEPLTLPQMKALVEDILQIPEASTCPHGRPLRVKFGLKELEAMFHRK